MSGNRVILVVAFLTSILLSMFLVFGVPGYIEPNPVISIRVVLGLAVGGTIVLLGRMLKNRK